jgi:hypothetical protein
VNKREELKRIYRDDCQKYLTFLDYTTLEATGIIIYPEANIKKLVKFCKSD